MNLDQELDTIIAEHEARERADQEMRERARQQTDAAKRLAFIADVEAELEDELRRLLGLTYNAPCSAHFDAQGVTWYIAPAPNQSQHWMVSGSALPNAYAQSGKLRETIMLMLATYRMRLHDHARLDRARAEHNARIAAQEAEKQAVRQAEHDRCAARIAEAVNVVQPTLWRWPEGREITLYHWRWCIAAWSEDVRGEITFDDGWSMTDRLTSDGYVPIGGRWVRLDMFAHKPIVEKHVFADVGTLPASLREDSTIDVDGIRDESDGYRTTCPWYTESTHDTLLVRVGQQPVEWVRRILER